MPMIRVGRVASPGVVDFLTREVPELTGDQVLIAIRASAICGSDLHIFKGRHPSVSLPATIGHEFSGVIEKVGANVTRVSVGDRVCVEPVVVCGMCVACRHGDYGYCENISFTYRMGDGAMADYVKVHEPYVYRLPDNMSFATGALVEPLAVAVHATRRADVKLGDRVAVFGGGAIGVLIAALSRRCGAAEVTVVDFADPRLELARSFGATRVLNPQHDDVLDQLDRIDKSFECVGVPDTLRQAMLCLRKNGLATVVGIAEVTDVAIPVSRFITHEIKVQGSQGYCWDFPTALACAQELEIERLITHTFSLDELQIALDTCLNRASDVLKVIIEP